MANSIMNRILVALLLAAPSRRRRWPTKARSAAAPRSSSSTSAPSSTRTTPRSTIQGPQGRGVEFGLEGATGVQRDRWSTLASGTWRFAPNHRVGFQSFSTRRHASKVIDQELVIKDEVIPVGTNLETTAKTDFLIVNYQYSLMRDDRIELSAMAGIYGARFRFTFDSTNPPRDIDAKTTAPLPMFGIALDTFITPRWTISTFFEGLYAQGRRRRGAHRLHRPVDRLHDHAAPRHWAWASAR